MRRSVTADEGGRRGGAVIGVWLGLLLAMAGCSRSGALSGDVVVRTAAGELVRGARIGVQLVSSTETFEREWANAIALFRQEVAPAGDAQKAAEQTAEQARPAWTRALTALGKERARGGQWTLSLRDTSAAGSQEHWRSVRATEGQVFHARKRVEEHLSFGMFLATRGGERVRTLQPRRHGSGRAALRSAELA